MKRTLIAVFVMLMVNSPVGPASAGLFEGKVVSFWWFDWGLNGPPYTHGDYGNKTVGPGIEVLNIADDAGTLDISDTTLYVDFTRAGAFASAGTDFNGFRISDVHNTISDITSVSINPVTNMAGFDSSRIAFDANNIWINFQGLTFSVATIVSLEVGGGITSLQNVLTFFDENVAGGSLEGIGPGSSANGRINAFRNMLGTANDLISDGDSTGACKQLLDAMNRCDGYQPPPDFIEGESAYDLRGLIDDFRVSIGCTNP